MNSRKVKKVSNSVHFSKSPWQYSQGPFYTPVKPTVNQLMSTKGFTREQTLCRLYLLFPRIAKHKIHKLFKMYNEDTLRTIDTLLFSEMTRIAKVKALQLRNRVPSAKKPHGQCARTCAIMYRQKKSSNWRTTTSGTVHNMQPDACPVPQVQQVLDNYNGHLSAPRLRNHMPNATFDNTGIKNIVFETLKPGDGGCDKCHVKNKPPHTHDTNTSILDNPRQEEQTVLRAQQLLDSNGTNQSPHHRHSLKMKLVRNGNSYSAKIIPS